MQTFKIWPKSKRPLIKERDIWVADATDGRNEKKNDIEKANIGKGDQERGVGRVLDLGPRWITWWVGDVCEHSWKKLSRMFSQKDFLSSSTAVLVNFICINSNLSHINYQYWYFPSHRRERFKCCHFCQICIFSSSDLLGSPRLSMDELLAGNDWRHIGQGGEIRPLATPPDRLLMLATIFGHTAPTFCYLGATH